MAIKGGDRLQQKLDEFAKKASTARAVRVGFLEGATYPDGGLNVPTVAAIQEFGAPSRGIPPRPFFRSMVAAKKAGWPATMAALLKANDYDAARTLGQMGEEIAGQLRESIIDTNEPPLSPVTLMLRKMRAKDPDLRVTGRTVGEAARRVRAGESYGGVSTKPLVDTGHLLNSIDYEIT